MSPKRVHVVLGSTKDAALGILKLAAESSDVFPPLKSICGGILFLADLADTFQSNKKEWKELVVYIANLINDLAIAVGKDASDELEKDVGYLSLELDSIRQIMQKLMSRSLISRVTQSKADLSKISQCRASIDTAMTRFGTLSNISLRKKVEALKISTPSAPVAPKEPEFSSLAPRPPAIFYGRDEELAQINSALKKSKELGSPARLVLRGGGGLGKTTLALAVFHHEDTKKLFDDRRFFVSCEATLTASHLINVIILALRLPQSDLDPLQQLRNYLLTSNEATFMILDNFETPWFGENQEDVRQTLLMLETFSSLTLLLTTRGTVLPKGIQWTKPILPLLLPFTLEAARETFVDIAGEEYTSPELDELLQTLGLVPLAVGLVASLVLSGGSSVANLQHAWDREKTAILANDGSSKHTNIEISIKISIDSRPVQSDPFALRLLAVICHLPDGASREDLARLVGVGLKKPQSAAGVLKAVSLIYEEQSRFKVLPPIRGFVLTRQDEYPLHPDDKQALFCYYTEIAMRGDCWPGDDKFIPACQLLPLERRNIHSIVSLAIMDPETRPSFELADAIWVYSKFLQLTAPNLDLLELVLNNARWIDGLDPGVMAKLMVQLGSTSTTMDQLDKGINQLEKARVFASKHGVGLQAAVALREIGTNYRHQGQYQKSLDAFLQAQAEFKEVGTERAIRLGVECRQQIGTLKIAMGSPEGTRKYLEETLRVWRIERPDEELLLAQALMNLGLYHSAQTEIEPAVRYSEEAYGLMQKPGWVHGEGTCLWIMGSAMALGGPEQLEDAIKLLEKAADILTKVGGRSMTANAYQALGIANAKLGRREAYEDYFARALVLFKDLGRPMARAESKRNLANCRTAAGDALNGIKAYQEARQEFLELGDKLSAARCLQGECTARTLAQNTSQEDLLKLSKEAREELLAAGDKINAAWVILNVGQFSLNLLSVEDAKQALEIAVKQLEEIGSIPGAEMARNSLALAEKAIKAISSSRSMS